MLKGMGFERRKFCAEARGVKPLCGLRINGKKSESLFCRWSVSSELVESWAIEDEPAPGSADLLARLFQVGGFG